MKKTIFGCKRLAMTGVLTLCLGLALAVTLVKHSEASTVTVFQFKFDPVEITADQAAHILFNNTSSRQTVHLEIEWRDATSGVAIGGGFQADVDAGHGVTEHFPGFVLNGTLPLIGVIRLSQASGAPPIPSDIGTRVSATFEVVNSDTKQVTVALGLSGAPAVLTGISGN